MQFEDREQFEDRRLKRAVSRLNLKKSELVFGLVEALKSEIFIWK